MVYLKEDPNLDVGEFAKKYAQKLKERQINRGLIRLYVVRKPENYEQFQEEANKKVSVVVGCPL